MEMQAIGESNVRYDYLRRANEMVQAGVSRVRAIHNFQKAAFKAHVRQSAFITRMSQGHQVQLVA